MHSATVHRIGNVQNVPLERRTRLRARHVQNRAFCTNERDGHRCRARLVPWLRGSDVNVARQLQATTACLPQRPPRTSPLPAPRRPRSRRSSRRRRRLPGRRRRPRPRRRPPRRRRRPPRRRRARSSSTPTTTTTTTTRGGGGDDASPSPSRSCRMLHLDLASPRTRSMAGRPLDHARGAGEHHE